MKPFPIILSTLAVTALVGAAGTYAFVNSGLYDISATTADSGLVYWATHQTMEHSVARRFGANVVPEGMAEPQKIAQGGQLFVENCAVCHGRPRVDPSAIAQGLNPAPADLYRATREPDEQENFQFIKYGIKMTGMPAFAPSHSDDEIWSLVAFLNLLPGITSEDFTAAITQPVAPASEVPVKSGG